MKNFVLKKTFFSNRFNLIEKRKNLYARKLDNNTISKIQLERFNKIWYRSFSKIDFYDYWKKKFKLPSQIYSIDQLKDFPHLRKKDLIENQDILFNQFSKKKFISTGGSTGEPTKFPSSQKDFLSIYADAFMVRSWWNIEPFDKMVSFWGHSHLFGDGILGKFNEFKRKLKDYIVNIERLNAYDVHSDTIKEYYYKVKKIKPLIISGYTSCIAKLAMFILENNLEGTVSSRLRVVIPTSETVSLNDKINIQKAFKVPVAIEYGMAETGIIAHSSNVDNHLLVLWNSFLCNISNDNTLLVNTLDDLKLFPLINYYTEDKIEVSSNKNNSILSIKNILGRKQEEFKLLTNNNQYINVTGILIVHILKNYRSIYSVQAKQVGKNNIKIYLTSSKKLNLFEVKEYFLKQIYKDHPNVDSTSVDIIQSKSSQKSLSGKEKILWEDKIYNKNF